MMVRSLTHICVTRPKWVKMVKYQCIRNRCNYIFPLHQYHTRLTMDWNPSMKMWIRRKFKKEYLRIGLACCFLKFLEWSVDYWLLFIPVTWNSLVLKEITWFQTSSIGITFDIAVSTIVVTKRNKTTYMIHNFTIMTIVMQTDILGHVKCILKPALRSLARSLSQWPSYQKRKIAGCPCVTHLEWYMPGSLTSGFPCSLGGENVPDIPGACATRKFTYQTRSPWNRLSQNQRARQFITVKHRSHNYCMGR